MSEILDVDLLAVEQRGGHAGRRRGSRRSPGLPRRFSAISAASAVEQVLDEINLVEEARRVS